MNGEIAPMGLQVAPDARIEVDPKARGQQQQQVTILLNKPVGYVSGQAEDGHQPAVVLVQERTHWKGDGSRLRFSTQQVRGLAPAGRLDIDSIGLLVLTQDGRVARQLIGEDSGMEKEYLVRVVYPSPQGEVTADVQRAFPPAQLARLRQGLALDGQPLCHASGRMGDASAADRDSSSTCPQRPRWRAPARPGSGRRGCRRRTRRRSRPVRPGPRRPRWRVRARHDGPHLRHRHRRLPRCGR